MDAATSQDEVSSFACSKPWASMSVTFTCSSGVDALASRHMAREYSRDAMEEEFRPDGKNTLPTD